MERTSDGLRCAFALGPGRAVWIASEKRQWSASRFWASYLTKRSGLRASRLRGLGFRLSARVSGLGNFWVVRDRATCRDKRGTFLSAQVLRGVHFGPGTLLGGRKQGLPDVGDLRYLMPWMVWSESGGGESVESNGQLSFWVRSVRWLIYVSSRQLESFRYWVQIARPGFLEDTENQTGNRAYLRGAFSCV